MSVLNILHYPDARLRNPAKPVAVVDDSIRQLVDDMFETMYDEPGIGLAAVQVNVAQRVVVMDLSEDRSAQRVFINPEIIEREGLQLSPEGCLSVPGFFEDIERAAKVKVRALDRAGKPFELEADNLLAACVQHELDHLNGKLFVDYLSELKRNRIRKKLEKLAKVQPQSTQHAPVY